MKVDTERPGAPPSAIEAQASATAPTARKRGGGPRTPEGKENSKRNAVRHSLTSEEVLTEELAAVLASRAVEFRAEFGPRTPYEDWLVGQIARATVQLDRCHELMLVDL